MVLSPYDVVKTEEPYDLLIVDEAHRLQRERRYPTIRPLTRITRSWALIKMVPN